MATTKAQAEQAEHARTGFPVPDTYADVKSTVTLRGVRTLHNGAERIEYKEAVGLAYNALRGTLPSVREVETQTGISKSKVGRMVAAGLLGMRLNATVSEGIELLYLIEQRFGGSYKALVTEYGSDIADADRADALQWIAERAAETHANPDQHVKARQAQPGKVKASVTTETKIRAARDLLASVVASGITQADLSADLEDYVREVQAHVETIVSLMAETSAAVTSKVSGPKARAPRKARAPQEQVAA